MQHHAQTQSVLLIEDDESIQEIVTFNLANEGFTVESVADGTTGLTMALSGRFSLVILDLHLPGMNGLDICKQIRKQREFLPILMLTSKVAELDRVVGLEVGADDYLGKPFSVKELIARVRARLRVQSKQIVGILEAENNDPSELLVRGPLVIDRMRRTVSLSGNSIPLTPKEFDVLCFLAANPGRPYTREQLLNAIWGVTAVGYEDSVSQVVKRLRRKLGDDPRFAELITTVRGIGYAFSENPHGTESRLERDVLPE